MIFFEHRGSSQDHRKVASGPSGAGFHRSNNTISVCTFGTLHLESVTRTYDHAHDFDWRGPEGHAIARGTPPTIGWPPDIWGDAASGDLYEREGPQANLRAS